MKFKLPKPDKPSKTAFSVIIGLIVVLLIVLGLFLGNKHLGWFRAEEPVPIPETYVPSDRAKTFGISSEEGDGPRFVKEVTIDPFSIRTGDNQYFSIWIEDPKGIERITIELETDGDPEIADMALVEGTPEAGRWLGGRIAEEFYKGNYYLAIFRAKNMIGEEKKMNILWRYEEEESQSVFDFFFPTVYAFSECVINETGDTTLDATCEVSGTRASGGNLYITGSDTIILIEEDSILGAEGGDITIDDATIQMLDRSSLFFNDGALRNNNGRVLTSEEIRIVKGETPSSSCECSAGDACCSDGCTYDADETVCWIGAWQKTCSWSSICDETADGTITRDYKTCKNGQCNVLEEETDTAFCFRDTNGDECDSSNVYCDDCRWEDECDEFAWGDEYAEITLCKNGKCKDVQGTEKTGNFCACRRETEDIVCDSILYDTVCKWNHDCHGPGLSNKKYYSWADVYKCYNGSCEHWGCEEYWENECCPL